MGRREDFSQSRKGNGSSVHHAALEGWMGRKQSAAYIFRELSMGSRAEGAVPRTDVTSLCSQ